MTEPLTNSTHDVSGMDGFMLDTEKLMASELWALSTGDEFKAAVGLWCRAWKQSPPGSLPNDERILAAYSGAGKNWRRVREVALRGFVLCEDGRLYHKTLCGDAVRASAAKAKRKERTRAATEARNNQRNVDRDEARNANVTNSHVSVSVSEEDGIGDAREPLAELEAKLREAAGWQSEPAPNLAVTGPVMALIEAGALLETDVLPTVRSLAPQCRSRSSWKYFLKAIAQARDDRIAAGKIVSPPPSPTRNPQNARKSSVSDAFAAFDADFAAAVSRTDSGGAQRGGETALELPRLREGVG